MVNIVTDVAHILVLHDGFTLLCEASCDYTGVFCRVHSGMSKLWRVEEKEVDNQPEGKNRNTIWRCVVLFQLMPSILECIAVRAKSIKICFAWMSVPNLDPNHIEYQLSQIFQQILSKANLSTAPYKV